MKAALPILLLSIVIAALVSWVVATTLGPESIGAQRKVLPNLPAPRGGAPSAQDVTDLRMTVARLEEEVLALQLQLAQVASLRSGGRQPASTESEEVSLAASLANLNSADEQAFHAEVSKVVARLEEEKAAAAWEEELAKRREKAIVEFAEYDAVHANLDQAVSNLATQLGTASFDARDMRSLLALQNDRNREMTRVWSEGKTPQAELEQIYHANQAAHRAEILAMIGEGAIESYKKFVREGGLGGQFSFFIGAWEDWSPEEGQ